MEANQHRRREAFLRIKDFAANHTDIAVVPVWPQLVTDLNQLMTGLAGDAAAEAASHGAALQGTDFRGQARHALREAVERVVRTARAIAEDHDGFNARYRTPDSNNDQDWIDAALGMATSAAAPESKALFVSHGLPPTFIEDLREDVGDLQNAITDQSGKVGDRKSSGVKIEQRMESGMSIRRKMDAVVHNFYANNPAVLAEWETANHIERAPQRKRGGPEEPPAAPNP